MPSLGLLMGVGSIQANRLGRRTGCVVREQALRMGGVSDLENSIASASIVSASCKGHPVDALALEAEEGRYRLR